MISFASLFSISCVAAPRFPEPGVLKSMSCMFLSCVEAGGTVLVVVVVVATVVVASFVVNQEGVAKKKSGGRVAEF